MREKSVSDRGLLDLRGTICPMNFVKTKLKLEELSAGDLLELLLDDGEPIRNVSRSVQQEGHKVVDVTREKAHYRVLVEKGQGTS